MVDPLMNKKVERTLGDWIAFYTITFLAVSLILLTTYEIIKVKERTKFCEDKGLEFTGLEERKIKCERFSKEGLLLETKYYKNG